MHSRIKNAIIRRVIIRGSTETDTATRAKEATRLIWCTIILSTFSFLVTAEQDKKEKSNVISVNDKDNVINNEITRKPYTNKTIAKVEAILAKNSSLPRLTRGEILEILENITKTDEVNSQESKSNIPKGNDESSNKSRQEKSLLVVLPFNPSNDTRGGLEVLYTKEPMTRLMFEGTTSSYSVYTRDNATTITASTQASTTVASTTPRPHKRRRKPMKPIVVMGQQEQRPVYVHNTRTSTTTQPPVESSSEEQWKPYTAYNSPAVVTQKPPNVEIPLPESMRNTLSYLNLPKNHKPDGQAVYVTLPDRPDFTTSTTKRPWKKTTKPKFSTTTTPTTPKPRTTKPTAEPMPDISGAMETLTPEMKDMLANLGLVPGRSDGGMTEISPKIITTPQPIQFKPINPTVDISSYMSFKPLPVKGKNNNNNAPMDKDMKQILSNFGLIAPESQPITYYGRMQKSLDLDEENMNFHSSEGTINENSTSNENETNNKTMTLTEINTDVLSDEMKDMLEDLGVIKNSKRRGGKVHIFNPVTQSALLDQPDHAERISKVLVDIKKLSESNATHALHPDEIKAQLENITSIVFTDDDNSNKDDDLSFSQSENEADDDTDHGIVFGAHGNFDGYEPDEEELLRIQGVNTFTNNNNGNFNFRWNNTEMDDTTSKRLKEILSPPDPLSLEELHHAIDAINKNEVKRQQPNNSSTESPVASSTESDVTTSSEESLSSSPETTTSSTTTETPSSSTTEETSTTTSEAPPNIKDLEDSFGGETPLVRPNGLYFLLDWNSFLRVGQDNRTVNLQFSPKVGDPRNFIPVNVP